MRKLSFIGFVCAICVINIQVAQAEPQSYTMVCNPGPGMHFDYQDNSDVLELTSTWKPGVILDFSFTPAKQPANVQLPEEGQCSWVDRTVSDDEPKVIHARFRNAIKIINAAYDRNLFQIKVWNTEGSDFNYPYSVLLLDNDGWGCTEPGNPFDQATPTEPGCNDGEEIIKDASF